MAGSTSASDDATVLVRDVFARASSPAGPELPARVGRYVVIEELGRGGMGVVLRAYDPKLQREVALKLVRTDALGETAQARLVREARAMARLAHPNVVAVYDVELGSDDGVLVVMEYVPGTTLREWSRDGARSWSDVLEMFVAAGRGLAAAHAEGLLHRDFKLDNVLVGTDGRARVTDFGLARAVGSSRSTDEADLGGPPSDDALPGRDDRDSEGLSSELTAVGTVLGTPRAMAPEHMQGGSLDARADQYSFCVALWRALTGAWPFEGEWSAMLDAKRTGPPPWPSHVVVPRNVIDAVRRGLAPDPAARWPTLPDLLGELERDPSRRRRRWLAVASVALALAVGAAGLWTAQRVQRARTLAACAAQAGAIAVVWNDARADRIAAAFEATEVAYASDTWNRSRQRLGTYADEWATTRAQVCEGEALDHTVSSETAMASRACLDERADELDALLAQLEQPDAEAVNHAATATASLPLLLPCTDETWLSQRAVPPADADVREQVRALRVRLAQVEAAGSTGRYAWALQEAEAVLEAARVLGWPPLQAEASLHVGEAYERVGRYEDARAALEAGFFTAGAAGQDELALRTASALVWVVGFRLAQPDQSRRWSRIAQMLIDRLGLADDLAVARLLDDLGNVQLSQGAHADALASHERALAIRERVLGPEHLDVAMSLNNLGAVHQDRGAQAEAQAYYERVLTIQEQTLGPEHPMLAVSLNNLGVVQLAQGTHAEAQTSHERALAIQATVLGEEHPEFAMSLNNLSLVHHARGAHADGLALSRRALSIMEKSLGPEHPNVAMTLHTIAGAYFSMGEYGQARTLEGRALAIWEKTFGPEHPNVAMSLVSLAAAHRSTGEYVRAHALLERALAIAEKVFGREHFLVAISLVGLAEVALGQRRAVDAARFAEQAVAILERDGSASDELARARFALAQALWDDTPSRPRAVELARAARDAYREADPTEAKQLGAVQAWLAEHDSRAAPR